MSQFNNKMVLAALVLATLVASAAAADEPKKAAPPEPKIKVGDTAPDFKLKDQTGKDVALHDFRGKKSVALAFYVFAFTGG
jgi:cytochrome oxidase Cu insertion factor (SCO1/SenC/PrrC family)